METGTTVEKRDPYQYEAAEAAGSQGETAGSNELDIRGVAADRYRQMAQASQQAHLPSFLSGDQRPDRINVSDTERMISVIGGLALTVAGITRRSTAGLLMTVAGAALVQRGASGHCALNSLMGRSTAKVR